MSDSNQLMAPGTGPYSETWAEYRALGWRGVIPTPKYSKTPPPRGYTGANGKTPDEGQCQRWAYTSGQNIALRLSDTEIAIDVDHYGSKRGGDQLDKLEQQWGALPPTWRTSSRGADNPSGKRLYRVPSGLEWPTELSDDIEIVQHRHRYAMVWPSVVADKHDPSIQRTECWYDPSGEASERPPGPGDLTALPDAWVEGIQALTHAPRPSDLPAEINVPSHSGAATNWRQLMMLPSDDPGRGNDTSLRVAGGAVELCVRKNLPYDLALGIVLAHEGTSDDPQQLQVVQDQVRRMWAKERVKKRMEAADTSAEATGYLVARGSSKPGYDTIVDGPPDKTGQRGVEVVPFGDFTLVATGVHTSASGQTTWTVDLTRRDSHTVRGLELTSDVLASTPKLRAWLLGHRCSLFFCSDRDQRGGPGVRLRALMESQRPADYRVVDCLGWDDREQVYITYEGAITAEGLNRNASVRPSRDLVDRGLVNHTYGFAPEERTREVVRQVMTFQEETYASVYGAWYTAALVKGQLMRAASMFPILINEAPAESGKTKGFPSMWYQLSGSREPESGYKSAPVFRDQMTAHRGAPVWVDDSDAIDRLTENLRQAPMEGQAQKMGEDRRTAVKAKLVAPVLISGEGIASVHEEKAIKDRSVLISAPNPKGRMSLVDPSRPQWDDIQDLEADHPDGLSVYSGTLVQLALRYAPARVGEFKKLRVGSGRHADKMATLRVGARILADITGDWGHVERVDRWVGAQQDTGDQNALTLKVIPAAVTVLGLPSEPVRLNQAPHRGVTSPLVWRAAPGGTSPALWVHVGNLAEWWSQHRGGRGVSERTETVSALGAQAKALGMKGKKSGQINVDWAQFDVSSSREEGNRSRVTYQRVPDQVAAELLESLDTEVSDGKNPTAPGQLNAAQRELLDRV